MNGFVGGIAEMYLVNEKEEAIFLRKRLSTIKVAIEEVLACHTALLHICVRGM